MKLSQFCRIKWERARDLKKKGAFQEAALITKSGGEPAISPGTGLPGESATDPLGNPRRGSHLYWRNFLNT